MREIKFRGLCLSHGIKWYYGLLFKSGAEGQWTEIQTDSGATFIVDDETVGQFTGLKDKNGREIYENDITELEVDGNIRRFVVKIKIIVRELVSHPSFFEETAKVAITGVVFEWNGFELFPCVDENGQVDNEKMVVVGNIYEHPHLLEVVE